jgi:hypothetical protein
MFRDSPDSYKGNPFIEAVSKPGVFSQFFYKGTHSRLDGLFYNGWTEKVRSKLNLSEGLFLSLFLADLYAAIQNVKQFKCFDQVMKKLSGVGDDFMPTVFEVEMSEHVLHMFKNHLTEIEFAGCFKTKDEKEIDLRAKIKDEWIYFEMTKVMAYEKSTEVLRLHSLMSAFLVGAKMETQKNLELLLGFPSIPDQKIISSVVQYISGCLTNNRFNVNDTVEGVTCSVRETTGDPRLELQIKSDLEKNKLKDKYFEELEHFDKDGINIIAIDTTYLPREPEKLVTLTGEIFETEGDLSIVAAVIFVSKEHLVRPNGFPLQTVTKNIVKFNKKCDKADFLRGILLQK